MNKGVKHYHDGPTTPSRSYSFNQQNSPQKNGAQVIYPRPAQRIVNYN